MIDAVQREGTCWFGATTWHGMRLAAYLGVELVDDRGRRRPVGRRDRSHGATSVRRVKVGVFVPIGTLNANAEFVRTLGPALEERGFESVWVAEHVVLFDDYESQYPYADNGRFPGGGDTGLLEPLTALTYLAAVTDTRPPRHRHLPRPAAQPRVHRQAGRRRRRALRAAASTSASASAGCARSSRRSRMPFERPRRADARAPRGDEGALDEGVRRRSRASTTTCRSAACTRSRCSSRTRRSTSAARRRGAPPGRRPRPGLVRVQPHARGGARRAGEARSAARGARSVTRRDRDQRVPVLQGRRPRRRSSVTATSASTVSSPCCSRSTATAC